MKKFRAAAAAAATAALACAMLGIGLAACGSKAPSTAPAAGGKAAASACPGGSLSFGIEPYDDPSKLIPAYQAMAAAVGKTLGCKVSVTIADSYVAEILAMKNGKLDFAEFGPLGYVFADQEAGAIPVASFADSTGQVSSYTAGIWVKKGSPIKTVKDLAGHTLALSETGSTSGDAIPRELLVQNGIDKQVKVEYAGGHPQAELALVNGKVDAAEINSQTVASLESSHKFDPAQYTQVWKSAPILNDPVTISPKLPARKAISDAILSVKAPALTQVGGELDFTSPASGPAMVPVTKTDYQPLFTLAKTLGLTEKNL